MVFGREKLVYCPGLIATGVRRVVLPCHLTSPNKPTLFYPGERESILRSGSADGSTGQPPVHSLSVPADGFRFTSGYSS